MNTSVALRETAPEFAPVVEDFATGGYHLFPRPVDPASADALLRQVRGLRRFDASLFLSEAEFDANPTYRGVNPVPGRNLLDQYAPQLGFVEQDPMIREALSDLLGQGYRLNNRKFVCGVPASVIPDWLKARIQGNPVNNLGPYVRPEFRDITYFYGIDFHQDLIDFPDREADMVTLYVYLHRVGDHDAPLYLLEGSHALGATLFPHWLEQSGPTVWRYSASDRDGAAAIACRQRMLTGDAGFAAMWHGCTLHGTQPDQSDLERLSLRYLFVRDPDAADCGLDRINATLDGPLTLTATRKDLDANGKARMKFNAVNRA
jgi:hypothetical protein